MRPSIITHPFSSHFIISLRPHSHHMGDKYFHLLVKRIRNFIKGFLNQRIDKLGTFSPSTVWNGWLPLVP